MDHDVIIAAIENCNVAVLILKLEDPAEIKSFKVEYVNKATQKANGSVPEEIIGKYLTDVYPGVFETYPDLIEAYKKGLNGVETTLGVIPYEDENVKLGYFNCTISPLTSDCIAVYYENVTENEAFKKEVVSQVQELERINDLLVGRELKMADMKKEISQLKNQLKESN